MSENTDWTLIVRNSQRAVAAAEGALAVTERLATEFGYRLGALEGRFGALEGRVASLAAGLDSVHRAVLRIADTQLVHEGRFDLIDRRFDAIDPRFDGIEATLAMILAKLA